MGSSSVHHTDNKTNNALKKSHNKFPSYRLILSRTDPAARLHRPIFRLQKISQHLNHITVSGSTT